MFLSSLSFNAWPGCCAPPCPAQIRGLHPDFPQDPARTSPGTPQTYVDLRGTTYFWRCFTPLWGRGLRACLSDGWEVWEPPSESILLKPPKLPLRSYCNLVLRTTACNAAVSHLCEAMKSGQMAGQQPLYSILMRRRKIL